MSQYVMDKLRQDIDKVLEQCAEKGIEDMKCLETVKTALSAKSKLLTIEAMEGFGRGNYERGYDRRANGQFRDDGNYGRMYRDENSGEYHDGSGNYNRSYHDSGKEHLKMMLARADPHEREVIEKMLHRM